MNYKQPNIETIDHCTEVVEKLLYFVFLFVGMIVLSVVSLVFALLIHGLYLSRFLLIKFILRAQAHFVQFRLGSRLS